MPTDQLIDAPDADLADQGTDAPEEPQAPVMVRIRYNGDTYEVPEHMADVWFKREEDHKRQLSELDRLRKAQQQPRQEQPVERQDDDTEFWTDPRGFIKRELEAEREQRRQDEALAQARAAYWAQFDRNYPHLRGKEVIVQAVLGQIMSRIAHLPPDESQRELADAVDTVLGAQDQGEKRPLRQGQVSTERASNQPAPRRQPPQETPPPKSTHDFLRERARNRRAAQFKTPKE